MEFQGESIDMIESDNVGPGQAFAHFIVMEELIDKLTILNYDQEFVKDLKMKSLSRHYFAIQTNPGEQFYLFASLAGWLIRKCGKSFEQPQEYDDPNSIISNIFDILRSLNINVNFPPSRIKQGFGEHVIYILDQLADEAIKILNIKWSHPELVKEVEEAVEEIEDEAELILEKVEEEMATFFCDDDDDESAINLEDLRNIQIFKDFQENQQKPEEILKSNVTSEEWLVELERVLPQLKVTIKTDSRDWRNHLEQMQKFNSSIEEVLPVTKSQLDKLHGDITNSLAKISTREKHINSQLEPLLINFRNNQDELSKLTELYKNANEKMTEKSKVLTQITEELEHIKKEMEERGASMTDGAPLINIKKAIAKIKNEIIELDVKIGVFENEILQQKLKDKTFYQQDIDSPTFILS
ncbi:ift57/hippi/che-13, putative [Pediculus humanus corporis]|uniref:Ift57/hippi/che-13, putative n=1 Tax=Pediculus humanus subsp. corporis TaxID=121224 RepID=E0W3W5_PEDHC|nr:ift57/hippi/che-13, putative [Pediculus humanus corporis]EEB20321.1 ift57/hippi/che-13, putative [Pediculus humanus corporis]